jgi:hypothetical protein
MKTVIITIDPENVATLPKGRVNYDQLDATLENAILAQQVEDDAEAAQEAALAALK